MTSHKDSINAWASKLYGEFGLSCIPMSKDAKKPIIRTSQWWGKHVPLDMILGMDCNIALATGTVNRLIVIDVDNPSKASDWFTSHPVLPSTWSVKTGGGGLHLYFRQPDWWKRDIPKAQLWKGEGKHEEVLCLGDKCMAICPPSCFTDGRRYRFESGLNPLQSRIAYAPGWLMKEIVDREVDKSFPEIANRDPWTFPVRSNSGLFMDYVNSIPDKIEFLKRCGLRLAGSKQNASGWIPCHRPGEKDETPSASVRPDTGQVWSSTGGTMSLVDTAVALGAFLSVQDCINHIRQVYSEGR